MKTRNILAGMGFAAALGITTEMDRVNAFGDYLAEVIGNKGHITPAQFIVKAEIALINLKNGFEGDGRLIRKTIRKALSGKNEKVYGSIRNRLPEIARAVATTGFAIGICNDANNVGKTAFEYARGNEMERYLDEIAASVRYGQNR